jgi:hypothetical protein
MQNLSPIQHDALIIARSIKEAHDAHYWARRSSNLVMRDIYLHRYADWLAHANKAIDEWNARYADAPERDTLSWFSFTERKHDYEVWAFLLGRLA